jgi:hypothetical protein
MTKAEAEKILARTLKEGIHVLQEAFERELPSEE